MGLAVSPAHGVPNEEMCGSAGEVEMDPALGARFSFGKELFKRFRTPFTEYLEPYGDRSRNAEHRQTVHTMTALYAADQLRQRVAWAFSQTLAVSDGEVWDMDETWTSFYDIFVRNAFGSYRDMLREVSFSPVMARWLTFFQSGSYAYSGTVPDENYAREIMQLFSVGLWVLDQDGTAQRDATGTELHTYTNEDIVEQARIWTGWDDHPLRGNIAAKRISEAARVDPMRVIASRRDLFPKMDLHKGHIGDTYPLCTEQPPRAFLRIGAKYRFLGRTGKTQLTYSKDFFWSKHWEQGESPDDREPFFTPDAASSLHAELCQADAVTGACRPQSSVVLSVNLPCYGMECDVSTVRVVKLQVGTNAFVYYEYVPLACVSLAFLENGEGRFIENVNYIPVGEGSLIERVCADPRATVATAACCSPRSTGCFDYPCKYVEERMPFASALRRCEAHWQATPPPPGPPPTAPPSPPASAAPPASPPGGNWFVHPAAYRTAMNACPEGSHGPDEAECLAAATVALATAGEPHFDAPGDSSARHGLATGSWSRGTPSGCVVDARSALVRYNRYSGTDGTNDGNWKLVCSTAAGAADYRNASSVLCSRKRAQCNTGWVDNCALGFASGSTKTLHNLYFWSEERCMLQAQVNVDGRVSVVHQGGKSTRRTGINSESWFRVRWYGGSFPAAMSNCGGACSVVPGESGSTCLCDVAVTTGARFTDSANVPTRAEVEENLRIGAVAPAAYDDEVYTQCATTACIARLPHVKVYTRGAFDSPLFDASAIFEIVVNQTGVSNGNSRFLANKQSVVTISSSSNPSAYSFRNPPQVRVTRADPHPARRSRQLMYATRAVSGGHRVPSLADDDTRRPVAARRAL